MKRYVKEDDNTIHYISDIRREHPYTSLSDDANCEQLGYYFLEETPKPIATNSIVVEGPPVNNKQTWVVKKIPFNEIKQDYSVQIQLMLDNKAKEYGYDSIMSACSYAGYDNPFRTEAEAFGIWRASCWTFLYEQLKNTEINVSTQEMIAMMPTIKFSGVQNEKS